MSHENLHRLTGVFNECETRTLRDAYLLARHSLAMTHTIDDSAKGRLADIVLNIFTTETGSDRRSSADVTSLAARSVARYLTFQTLNQSKDEVTLH